MGEKEKILGKDILPIGHGSIEDVTETLTLKNILADRPKDSETQYLTCIACDNADGFQDTCYPDRGAPVEPYAVYVYGSGYGCLKDDYSWDSKGLDTIMVLVRCLYCGAIMVIETMLLRKDCTVSMYLLDNPDTH
jgi:hypothetical protein